MKPRITCKTKKWKLTRLTLLKKGLLHRCSPIKITCSFLNAIFTEHLWATASDKAVFIMFYSLKIVLRYKKIFPEKQDNKLATQNWIFDHQGYFIKASVFTEVIKKDRDRFQQSLSSRIFKKIYSVWESTFVREGRGKSSKKGHKQMGERSIDGTYNY